MKFANNLIKLSICCGLLAAIGWYLHFLGILKMVISVLSVLYLLFYFTIGTIAVFSVISDLGQDIHYYEGPMFLFAFLLNVLFIMMMWIVCLLIWPLFAIPDDSLHKKQKYGAISQFETEVVKKYGRRAITPFNTIEN